MPRLLVLLMLCNLVIGSGAFVMSGIVEPVSQSLGVSVAAAGQAMTVYALATALLVPVALVLTGRWSRRQAMGFGLVVFALGNAVCATATSLHWLYAGRALMGVGAVFTPIAAGIAVAVTEPARRGRALSLVFLGMSLSQVIGVPLGAWVAYRHGWHWPFVLVAAMSALGALAVWWTVPKALSVPGAGFAGLPTLLRQRAVWWVLSFTLLYFMAIFIVFSYIGPVLQALVPMSLERMSLTLVVFGASGVVGTLAGGWANDRFGSQRTLVAQMLIFGLMMLAVPLTRGHYGWMLGAFVVWGIVGFGMMTPQQSRLAAIAPAQAPLLFSLNASMVYLGTALGAAVGGAFAGRVGMVHLAWLGVPLAVLALATMRLGPRPGAAWQPT